MTMAGFFLLSIKEKCTKEERLSGGVTKYTITNAPTTGARVFSGILTLGVSEALVPFVTNEEYQYFYGDVHLGKTRNEAADTANQKGLEFCNQGNFEEAKKLFEAAYQTCESGFSNEQKFHNSRDVMTIAMEGQNLLNSGHFSQAEAKFEEAYNLSNVSEVYTKLNACRDTAKVAAQKKAAEEQAVIAAAEKKAATERAAKVAAEKKAAEERAAQIAAAKKAQEERIAAEKKAIEERAAKVAAEKKAAEERAAQIAAAKKAQEERIAAEKKAVEERAAKVAAEKKAAEERAAQIAEEKKAAEERATQIVAAKKAQEERIAAEKKAVEERAAKVAAEKKAAEERAAQIATEKKAAEQRAAQIVAAKKAQEERIAAEKKAVEERAAQVAAEKKAEENNATVIAAEKLTAKKQITEQHIIENEPGLEQPETTGTRWKQAVEKYMTEQPATKIVTRWKEIAEALKINEQGLKLYREGKLKEAAAEIELALDMYEKAVSKFNEAATRQPLDIIFNSFIMVIAAFIENKAYEEAQKTIDHAKDHFSDKTDALTEAERMIENDNWSPDYVNQYLVQVDQQSLENNIMEHSDGY